MTHEQLSPTNWTGFQQCYYRMDTRISILINFKNMFNEREFIQYMCCPGGLLQVNIV